MEEILIRRQEEAGMRPLDDRIISYRADGYAKHLINLGVHPDDFNRIYELGIEIYNSVPPQGPFGIDHMIQGVRKFKESKKEFVIFKKPAEKFMVSCTTCQGSKIAFLKIDGKVIGLERDNEGNIKTCGDCNYESEN